MKDSVAVITKAIKEEGVCKVNQQLSHVDTTSHGKKEWNRTNQRKGKRRRAMGEFLFLFV